MLTNFICRRFNLISKTKIIDYLCMVMYKMELSKDTLKAKYDASETTEWSYYKHLWNIRGRLSMLEEIIDKLGE